jgi:type IV pilus assembly protein PilX
MIQAMPRRQQGATLFIALIVLLVITLLALSSARETTLESKITGNFIEQQKLSNYAESALRQGEKQLVAPLKPREPGGCTSGSSYCFLASDPAYEADFTNALAYLAVIGDDTRSVKWYAIQAPSGAAEGQSENPEYGNMMLGIGTFRYEINSEARNDNGQSVLLRTTTAKVFN